jgi:GT2 family glycosyltransferase
MTAPVTFPPDVSVAIVAHNSRGVLASTIAAIMATGCPPSEVTVIDTASSDGTADWLGLEHPAVTVVTLPVNDGPNPARNEALRRSTKPYVLLMDADVRLAGDCPSRLRTAFDGNDVAVAAPLVLHASSPEVIQYAGGGLHFICEAVNAWKDRPVSDRGGADADIGAAPGCALLIDRAAAHDVGLFDKRYFMGKEDGDFLHRLRIAGFRIREVAGARVWHDSRPRTAWLFEYQIRNRWHFIARNYQARTILLLLPAFAIHEVLQFGVLVASGHVGSWLRAVAGLLKLAPALPRDRAEVARYRKRGDAGLLREDPLVIRADLQRGRATSGLKRAYDAWLRMYWRIVRSVVQS